MMNGSRKKLLIVVLLVVAGLVSIGFSLLGGSRNGSPPKQQGKITILYNLPSTQGVSVLFNNKSATQTSSNSSSATYSLAPGSYDLTVSDAGYNQFTANFSLHDNQTIIIDAHLQLAANPTINSIQQIHIPGPTVPGVSILNTVYFYGQTWAAVTVQVNGSRAVLVAQYSPASQSWDTVLGPGTSFDQGDTQNLPAQISDYLTTNNYVNPGG
jgi:hypothetical protein